MDIEFVVPTPDKKPDEPQTDKGKQLKAFLETPIPLPDGPSISSRGVGDVRPKVEGVESESIKTLTENLKRLDESAAPAITLDIEVSAIRKPTVHETALAELDVDDPRVLLQQQLGVLPGVDPERAARMANSLDGALSNMTVAARRELDLARRQARRAASGKKNKGKRGRKRKGR